MRYPGLNYFPRLPQSISNASRSLQYPVLQTHLSWGYDSGGIIHLSQHKLHPWESRERGLGCIYWGEGDIFQADPLESKSRRLWLLRQVPSPADSKNGPDSFLGPAKLAFPHQDPFRVPLEEVCPLSHRLCRRTTFATTG